MRKILKFLVKCATSEPLRILFSVIFLNKISYRIFNYIYERSPHILVELFVRLSRQPGFDFVWKILLPNDSEVLVNVNKDLPLSFQFALSYRWHDPGLKALETLLNDKLDLEKSYFDIGANLGIRSLYPLSVGRRTILFEPNFKLNEFTVRLFIENGFTNYKTENLLMSDKQGNANFYLSPSGYLSSVSREHAMTDRTRGVVEDIVSEMTSIDLYLAERPDEIKPGIIKIDVEGHELQVLHGAALTVKSYKPYLIVEILKGSENSELIYDFMDKLGYRCYVILNNVHLKLKFLTTPADMNLDFRSDNFLFAESDEIIREFVIS